MAKRIGPVRRTVLPAMAVLALVSLAAGRLHAAPDPAPPDPAAPFLAAWSGLPGRSGWQMLVSVPFPLHWPPGAGSGLPLVRYAYAMRLRPGLVDGAEMSAPWARSTQGAAGAVTVTVSRTTLEPLGVQGVRPMSAAEVALLGREADAAGLLRAGGPGAEDPLVRATTCGWIARNGLVAATVTPLHPAFTRWLACGATPPNPGPR